MFATVSDVNELTYDIDAAKATAIFMARRRAKLDDHQRDLENGLMVIAVNEHATIGAVSQKLDATGQDKVLLAVHFPSQRESNSYETNSVTAGKQIQLIMFRYEDDPSELNEDLEFYGGTSTQSEIGLFCTRLKNARNASASIPSARGRRLSPRRTPVASLINA